MTPLKNRAIGFTCSYTPISLIEAAGFSPYRILPVGDSEDQAGQWMHDNVCPHVKRVLDRTLGGDLPENLAGVVIINSCDAMRRLADAWRRADPSSRVICIDLPIRSDERSVDFYAGQLRELTDWLGAISGNTPGESDVSSAMARFQVLAEHFGRLRGYLAAGILTGGAARLQDLYNRCATRPVEASIDELEKIVADESSRAKGVPVYLFGNVMPDAQAMSLFESCGARVVVEDLCTGSRLFKPLMENDDDSDVFKVLAESLLTGVGCARTIDAAPGATAGNVLARAKAAGAKGVIGHTVKFCDPYIARMPGIREFMREAEMPFLMLEGDCTLRSIGQHRTRIEAFLEMIG